MKHIDTDMTNIDMQVMLNEVEDINSWWQWMDIEWLRGKMAAWEIHYYSEGPGRGQISAMYADVRSNSLTNVKTGTDETNRIGQRVKVRKIDLKGIVVAGVKEWEGGYPNMNIWKGMGEDGEMKVGFHDKSTGWPWKRFVRTRVRVVVVRDKSWNDKGWVSWGDVFEKKENSTILDWMTRIDRMNRYEILHDEVFEVDADDPQMCFDRTIQVREGTINYGGEAWGYGVFDNEFMMNVWGANMNGNWTVEEEWEWPGHGTLGWSTEDTELPWLKSGERLGRVRDGYFINSGGIYVLAVSDVKDNAVNLVSGYQSKWKTSDERGMASRPVLKVNARVWYEDE